MTEKIFVPCPKCGKKVEYYATETRPFCSERCKVIDLGDWASGKYAVPTEETPSEESFEEKSRLEEE